ncbi:MAG TPA: antibiotic biosynthesis monooxygenase family protein [Marmoricola sp.]|nr:antibiotic biosynthesis monooxygenase family protein [Marmoricola sp.]
MLVVNRFRGDDSLRGDLESAVGILATMPGFEDSTLGRNLDEPDLWVLVTRWRDVGSYRRALSSYDVKIGVVPVLGRAVDEPSAFEVVEPGADGELNTAVPRDVDAR